MRRSITGVVIALSATCATAAGAATVIQTGHCGTSETLGPFGAGTTTISASCSVVMDKFDPSLGTLNAVDFSYLATSQLVLVGSNPTGATQTITPELFVWHAQVELTDPAFPTLAEPYPSVDETGNAPAVVLPPGFSGNFGGGDTALGDPFTFIGAVAVSGFNGPGVVSVPASQSYEFHVFFSDPSLSYVGQFTYGLDLTTTYIYTPTNAADPIPEPATWAMMLAGFVGVGAVARRRHMRSRRAVADPLGGLFSPA